MENETIKVLLGEDDRLTALALQIQLCDLGYRVQIQAGTPREVVSSAIQLKPDILILDLNIGGDTHGVEVARNIHDTASIPIVFLSASVLDVLVNEHAIPKPYRYVAKPFVLSEIHRAIQELVFLNSTYKSKQAVSSNQFA